MYLRRRKPASSERSFGAIFVEKTTSAPNYRLYALPGEGIRRPAMACVRYGGGAIAVEVWELPSMELGSFLRDIPAPLGLGKVELADGTFETGFICEQHGLHDALDITHAGGWRAWLAAL